MLPESYTYYSSALNAGACGQVHINPNFIPRHMKQQGVTQFRQQCDPPHANVFVQQQAAPVVHVNPEFLRRKRIEEEQRRNQKKIYVPPPLPPPLPATRQPLPPLPATRQPLPPLPPPPTSASAQQEKKSAQSRYKLVNNVRMTGAAAWAKKPAAPVIVQAPIVSKSRRKIIRQVAPACVTISRAAVTPTASISPIKSVQVARYKLDRRQKSSQPPPKREDLVTQRQFSARSKYSLNKTAWHSKIIAHKPRSHNKTLNLRMVNGVVYKATNNKWAALKTTASKTQTPLKRPSAGPKLKGPKESSTKKQRAILIDGTKYLMDSAGVKLIRLSTENNTTKVSSAELARASRKRIDVGGCTYVASARNGSNVFVRTDNHVTRAHLTSAKQRSLQQLSRPFSKVNVPCQIFVRIGKCSAHARGKCRKLHDRQQVAICQRFLRGECTKPSCLLSHNVSMAKMPICKFFLEGSCSREDCPYLHKKLSSTTDICEDFVRGFCRLAEKCMKRHEYKCPEFVRKGKCAISNCYFCMQMWRMEDKRIKATPAKPEPAPEQKPEVQTTASEAQHEKPPSRYFIELAETVVASSIGDVDIGHSPSSAANGNSIDVSSLSKRPKLGKLPSFISFS